MAGNNKTDEIEKQKRVYQVGLMLRRKPLSFIVEYIGKEWGLEKSQAYNYIKAARKEWKKYFEKLKGDGIAYHIAQIRDLKDQAYTRKVVIGKGKRRINEETGKTEMIYDNQQLITIADLGLVFEMTKEEAKLMGIYPKEKVEHSGEVKVGGKIGLNLEGMEIEEIRKLIRALEAHTGAEGQGRTEKEGDKEEPV